MDHRIMYTFLDAYDQNYKINSSSSGGGLWAGPALSVFISSPGSFPREIKSILSEVPVRLTISWSPRASPWPPPRGRIPGSPAPASSPASSPWSATAFGGRSGLKHESSSVCPPYSVSRCFAIGVLAKFQT